MIDVLKAINARLIVANIDKPEELKKQQLIKEILNEKNAFQKMDMKTVYQILEDLKIPVEKMRNIYLDLINPEPEELQ